MSNEQDNMTLDEFAEKVSKIPLSDSQKKLLSAYEQAENKQLIIIPCS